MADVTNALSAYMKDDTTRQRMIDQATEDLQAIHDTRMCFQSVYGLLAQVDAQNFTGSDGQVIQKFAPTWKGFNDAFTASFSQREVMAAKGKAAIDKHLDAMDQNNQNVTDIDALVSVFNNVSNDVASFQATFQEKITQVGMQVGNTTQVWNCNNLAPAIHVAYEDMASLQQKLNVQIQLERAKKSEIREQNDRLLTATQADDVEITDIRNAEIELAATSYANLAQILETVADGWTTPTQAVCRRGGYLIEALIIVFDVISKNVTSFKYTFELPMAQVKAEMARVGIKLTIDIQRANEDIALLQVKLDVQMNTAKDLRIIARVSIEHLSIVKEADDVEITDIRDQEIRLLAASYASLAQFWETFADGRSTPASTTTH
ncbi:hypothetical protein B0H16DRAFT_1729180 [Mycena metata]|uniref:Uncharacterized protein n=1 Tax=Mycena metata TaxID=1033252 RepID=A0AAD7IDY5_9AGAR|nr:hypothetical protein B0H16DRAFT_1729180 [Mycena metata]